MILCFDIGGTSVRAAIGVRPGALTLIETFPTVTGDLEGFLASLAAVARRVRPRIVGISIAGTVDAGGIAQAANIPCITGRPLALDIQGTLGCPVVIANDADCFAMAEATEGAGRGHATVLGLILGTGIGAGIVLNGTLLNAGGGVVGELGHGPVISGPLAFPCGCGQTGCLETVGSARGMERLHRHLHAEHRDAPTITANWQAGEGRAEATVALWCKVTAGPLAMAMNLIGPDVVPVGGGLANCPALIAELDAAVRARILRRMARPLLVPAACRIEPGLIGAAALAVRLHPA